MSDFTKSIDLIKISKIKILVRLPTQDKKSSGLDPKITFKYLGTNHNLILSKYDSLFLIPTVESRIKNKILKICNFNESKLTLTESRHLGRKILQVKKLALAKILRAARDNSESIDLKRRRLRAIQFKKHVTEVLTDLAKHESATSVKSSYLTQVWTELLNQEICRNILQA